MFAQTKAIHLPPHIDDVGQYERHENGNNGHDSERELAAAAVADGEARLQVGERGIEGRVVESHVDEQAQHHKHRACTREPDTVVERF